MFNVSALLLDDALNPAATPCTEQWRDQRNAVLWCFFRTQGSVATHLRVLAMRLPDLNVAVLLQVVS